MKHVTINVKSAKLIIQNSGIVDKVIKANFDENNVSMLQEDRTNFVDESNPIAMEQISNMLHVLFGKRPVPTYRQTIAELKRDSRIDEIASKCWMRFDTASAKRYTNKKGEDYIKIYTEFVSGKKNISNSHKTFKSEDGAKLTGSIIDYDESGNPIRCDAIIEWYTMKYKLKRYAGLYDELIKKFEDLTAEKDIDTKYSFPEFVINYLRKIDKTKLDELCEWLKSKRMTPISSFINLEKNKCHSFNQHKSDYATKVVSTHILKNVFSFDCTFVFEVTDEEYLQIKHGGHIAKYLDGGVAVFEPANQFDYDDFELESDGFMKLDEINKGFKIEE